MCHSLVPFQLGRVRDTISFVPRSSTRRSAVLSSTLLMIACASPQPEQSSTTGSTQTTDRPPRHPNAPTGEDDRQDTTPRPQTIDPFAEQLLAAHNRARAAVDPTPETPLPPLTWSRELEAHAKQVAAQCRFEHSEGPHGENLAARTHMADPQEIVGDWVAEQANFDYRKNRCASGKVCGHYTQVVWRASTQLGCAAQQCTNNGPFGEGDWVFWVCNYSPAGNFVGQRPY